MILASLAALRASEPPKFQSDVTLVKVEARVYDKDTGKTIENLTAADFQIRDEDQHREIVYFGKGAEPLDLVLLLDVSGTMREVLPEVAVQAANALAHLRRGDRAAVLAFGKRTAITQHFTGDFRSVRMGIRAALGAGVGTDTDINQAVLAAASYLRRSGGRSRRAILAMTDNIQETRTPNHRVEEQLYEADAVLDALVVRGRISLPRIFRGGGVFGFAAKTGGEVIEGPRPDLRFGEMIDRIRSRYTLYFRPVEITSDKPRRIRIELTPAARRKYSDAVVRARTRYYPAPPEKPAPEVPQDRQVARVISRSE